MTGVTERRRASGVVAFEAQVRLPRVDGRPLSPRSRTFASREAAQAWHDAELARVRAGEYSSAAVVPAGPDTLESWSRRWVPKALHWTPQAKAYALRRLELHVFDRLGPVLLTDLRADLVSDVFADLRGRSGQPLSHASKSRIQAILGQVLRAAVAQRLIEHSPMEGVRLPRNRAGRRDIVAWSPSQVQAFLTHQRVLASPLHSLLVAGFSTGCRRGELLGLTPGDLGLSGRNPHLWVRRSLHQDGTTDAPKTDNARRRMPLAEAPAAVAVLAEQLDRRAQGPQLAPQLWLTPAGRPLSPTAVSKAFDVLVRAFMASPEGRAVHAERLTFHGMRHSFASNHLAAGVPMATVSKLMGHASLAFTVDRYGHLLPEVADGLPALYVLPGPWDSEGEVA